MDKYIAQMRQMHQREQATEVDLTAMRELSSKLGNYWFLADELNTATYNGNETEIHRLKTEIDAVLEKE